MWGWDSEDWVTWKYSTEDPSGPYAFLVSKFHSDNHLTWCRIYWALWRYTPPPYKVLEVLYLDTKQRLVSEPQDGFPQMVRISVMVRRGDDVNMVKPRLYGSLLFVRVPKENVPGLRKEYKGISKELHLKYEPPT